ncbi:c-type cytochrome [Methylotuvimicrobium sp. KM2]|uniref:c-type cytochrome n=1 Tax=Methylotuvimicrobium sp. KM2 TaxID=3133976 RepID=UPI0031016BE4
MKNKLLALSIALLFMSQPVILHAEGNSKAGKEKATACAGCHGENGNSAVTNFPKLAQQHASYLIKTLNAFKSGERNNPMMSPIAMGLSDKDMADIAAYYAEQKISTNSLPVLQKDEDDDEDDSEDSAGASEDIKELLALGSDLYRNGVLASEVSACIACHGPFGEGNRPAAFPALKSQHADYLIKTLIDFKSGERSNNPENMMHMIAKKMTEREIKAVSYHISVMK